MDKITTLYNEKQSKDDKEIGVIEKIKKIKKKDRVIPGITDNLSLYEFEEIDGVKIYNGILLDKKQSMLDNIEFYKKISPCDKFTELLPSTLTARGQFTSVALNESDFIPQLHIPTIDYGAIIKIGCNFGELYVYPNPLFVQDVESIIKSIINLENFVIKVGCCCNENVLNVPEIKEYLAEYEKHLSEFQRVYLIIKAKFDSTGKIGNRLNKNLIAFQHFSLTNKEDIEELFSTIDSYLENSDDLTICINFMDNINKIMKVFAKYESACKCREKYLDMYNLPDEAKGFVRKSISTSTRGRKKKDKKAKRKVQGTGLYFSSQVTFDVFNTTNQKVSKIKVFRNGNFQVPGVKQPDMYDLVSPIKLLCDYLNFINEKNKIDKKVEINYVLSVMRNYTCKLQDQKRTIELNLLEEILKEEKIMPSHESHNLKYKNMIDQFELNDKTHDIFKYCNVSFYTISEINNNCERYPGLLIKFNRPIPNKDNKKLTVKILSSGKINFDGANSELEVYEIYYWIQYIFHKYWDRITYDPTDILNEIASSDSESGYDSVYDNDL